MKYDIDYMKEYISRRVTEIREYGTIFSMFVICLRAEGIPYQRFRVWKNRERANQSNLPFTYQRHFK